MHKIKEFVIFLIEHFPNHCKISEDEEDAGMYFNSGYLNNSRLDFKDYSKPLVVGSCGTYRLKKRPKLPTFFWAKGRRDYQILYVASGKAHFWFDGVEEVVTSGTHGALSAERNPEVCLLCRRSSRGVLDSLLQDMMSKTS